MSEFQFIILGSLLVALLIVVASIGFTLDKILKILKGEKVDEDEKVALEKPVVEG